MSKKSKSNIPTKKIPPSSKEVQHLTQQYSGPIPPPEILHRFDQVVPGAAERILKDGGK